MHSSNAVAEERYTETLASQHSRDYELTVGIPRLTAVNVETKSTAALVSVSVSPLKVGLMAIMLPTRPVLMLSQVSGART